MEVSAYVGDVRYRMATYNDKVIAHHSVNISMKAQNMARTIGITGNIACGKTFVGRSLLELGAERYIDADALVIVSMRAGQPVA